MTPDRFQKVKELFRAAKERSPESRQSFLAEACAGDEELRLEVLDLLSFDDGTRTFLQPPFQPVDPAGANEEAFIGRRIGNYQIAARLGSGGMGTVYTATRADDEFRKRVAIKLVRGGLDSADLLRRFRQERQTLAVLDHPHIVKLLDGGTTEDGVPYLVMELVEGMPIDQYCDRHRLTITARLELFRMVCSAVHYAHQNLVVHRDLKPGNILVTADGQPKLLDFGIAKLLRPEYAQTVGVTHMNMRPMTPEYASPEQIRGEPITTASDVYALGVVLYELLTGHLPYRFKTRSAVEISQAVCDQEPERPSTAVARREPAAVAQSREERPEKLRKRLTGDLDNIALMALRKEPQRRYASVEQFSEDIRRHLTGMPVIARKDTLGYRAGKFVGRHRWGVAAAVLLALALVTGAAGILWEAHLARAQKALAERRFNDLRKLAHSYLFEVSAAIATLPGSTSARKLVVTRGLEYLDSLAKQASGDASLQIELSEAYRQVGHVQGNPNQANLGDMAGAIESYRKSESILKALVAESPGNALATRELAYAAEDIADILVYNGNLPDAVAGYRKAAGFFEGLAASNPHTRQDEMDLARCLIKLGDRLGANRSSLGDHTGARESISRGVEIAESLVARYPDYAPAARQAALGHERLGDLYNGRGDAASALAQYEISLKATEDLALKDPSYYHYRRNIGLLEGKIGWAMSARGDLAQALERFQHQRSVIEALAAMDPKNAQVQHDLVDSYYNLGYIQLRRGNRAECIREYQKVLAARERLMQSDPANRGTRFSVAMALLQLTDAMQARDADDESAARTARALAILKEAADRPAAVMEDVNSYAWNLITCSPPRLRDPRQAVQYAERALAMAKAPDAYPLDTLAAASFAIGDRERAVASETKAISLLPAGSVDRVEFGRRLEQLKKCRAGDLPCLGLHQF